LKKGTEKQRRLRAKGEIMLDPIDKEAAVEALEEAGLERTAQVLDVVDEAYWSEIVEEAGSEEGLKAMGWILLCYVRYLRELE
jgi:hypothetical protein